MQVWPAIDIRGGQCVRLVQGDYSQETIFGDDPAAMARHWVELGASRLHLVDLDGARDGKPGNLPSIRAIVSTAGVPCQLGGGIRHRDTIEEILELGVSRLVLGTSALKHPDWFCEMIRLFPGRLVLGIDARDGFVATDGWLQTSQTPATRLAAQFEKEPLAAIIYTDIARDGMLAGPNVPAMRKMQQAVQVPVIASGGISSAQDIAQLAAAQVAGCIIGRALYEKHVTLAEALSAAASAGDS